MNKRIQKKVAKRQEAQAEAVQATSANGTDNMPSPLDRLRTAAADVEKSLREGLPKQAMRTLKEQAGEAIGQVTHQLQERLAEKQHQLQHKLKETEEQTEALLKKVPMVGEAAAKRLHHVTHR